MPKPSTPAQAELATYPAPTSTESYDVAHTRFVLVRAAHSWDYAHPEVVAAEQARQEAVQRQKAAAAFAAANPHSVPMAFEHATEVATVLREAMADATLSPEARRLFGYLLASGTIDADVLWDTACEWQADAESEAEEEETGAEVDADAESDLPYNPHGNVAVHATSREWPRVRSIG